MPDLRPFDTLSRPERRRRSTGAIEGDAGAGLGVLLSAPATRYIFTLVPRGYVNSIPFLNSVETNLPVAGGAICEFDTSHPHTG